MNGIGMKIAVVTGSGGLIGSQAVSHFAEQFDKVVGIDNDSRSYFFGDEASTQPSTRKLVAEVANFSPRNVDIRDVDAVERIFAEYGSDIKLVVHTAAQPSHDWAAREPHTDFTINANGTLNLLEATRKYCPQSVFVFTSTNKVYGDAPNQLPLIETDMRWELDESHPFFEHGIDETMSIDQCKHSLFGASKVAADILVQEYGKYFGIYTGVFRGGCLTGPNHAGTELHGFLSYLVKCVVTGKHYSIFGYQGKQVRDNIHSHDLIQMFAQFYQNPRCGEVYNAGGGRYSHCSMLEAIQIAEELTGNKLDYTYQEQNRSGDHIWYVSDTRRFQQHYPEWKQIYSVRDILEQIVSAETSKSTSRAA